MNLSHPSTWTEVRAAWAVVLHLIAWLSLVWGTCSTSIAGMIFGIPCAVILIVVTKWIREAAVVAVLNERRARDDQGQ